MIERAALAPQSIDDRLIEAVCARLTADRRVRRTLPERGRLHIDRQLPFLCVYRRPIDRTDAGTAQLVTSEASYLVASAAPRLRSSLTRLVQHVVATLETQFGGFLLVEIWAATDDQSEEDEPDPVGRPRFRLFVSDREQRDGFVSDVAEALGRVRVRKQRAKANIIRGSRWSPPKLPAILPSSAIAELGCTVLGIEIRPIYRDTVKGDVFPLVLRELERRFSRSMRQVFYAFTCDRTTHRPPHFHVLGRQATVKAVWDIDRRLAEVSDSFDFLLQVTPVNASKAWQEFKRHHCEQVPTLHYRPLPADPVDLKRMLYLTPVERLEDPALSLIFREKQDELDRKITMLLDIDTKRFLYGSLQLFGAVDDRLLRLARKILDRIPPRSRENSKGGYLSAEAFAKQATEEIAYYREQSAGVKARVRIRPDIAGGLMVSRGSLLIGKGTRIPRGRAVALLQHEVGTHVLTYYNGRAQPFRQLYSGLAGYEPLQEGLAVLSEYLVGGLSRPRLRLLAARVVGAHYLVDGASFVETFRRLHDEHGFAEQTAFTITLRLYRGGGLTKDAVYLKGLVELLEYLRRGGSLEPLLVGKLAAEHVPIIDELMWRNILKPPPLRPRYLAMPGTGERLARIRAGLRVLDLVERTSG